MLVPSSQLQAMSGYVTQQDVLPGMMTVREHLLFQLPHAGSETAHFFGYRALDQCLDSCRV